jgi:hypothetical protein
MQKARAVLVEYKTCGAHDNWDESESGPFLVQGLVDRLNGQLRQRLRDNFFEDALLKQIHDDATAGFVIAPTWTSGLTQLPITWQ